MQMEEGTHASSGDVEVKLANNKLDVMVDGDEREILINSDALPLKKEGNKEEFDSVLDGEFIKVEKEVGDVKESSHPHKSIQVQDTPSNSITIIHLLEAEDNIKSLELQLESVTKELLHSDSEKALLKSEVDLANEKLETLSRRCEELELDQKRMKEEVSAAEQKYSLQLASLQEALGALDVKHKDLGDLKESFSRVSTELESSRKKLKELEAELESSASEARKLEELTNERSSHAELESKRASELERMLELAKLREKKMEDQIGITQEEMKGLYSKVSENQQVEDALSHTTLELSVVKENLKLSEAQVADLEQKFDSNEDLIQELTRELDIYKASQERMKEELLALENLLSSSQDSLQTKLISLEEVDLKLQQEVKTREAVEASLKNQEMHMMSLQEELEKLTGEKDTLLSTVVDLNTNLSLTKELCSQLEDKFTVADQNFSKTDSLLSQALSYNADLEQKLKSLEELHGESRMVAETASQRNLELEDLIQSSNAVEEGVRAEVREKEIRLISAEQRNVELEEHIAFTELKFTDADREIKELNEKVAELTVMLSKFEEESELSKGQFQEYKDRISQLESSLREADSRNSELVQELKGLAEIRDAHEGRAAAAHQRSLELEDLVHHNHAKAENSGKKVEELELLLEATRHQTQNLEQVLSITEAKCRDAEAESKQHSSMVSELSTELEVFQKKSISLELVVQEANEKERELTNLLNEITGERKKFEDLSNISSEKILQAENMIEVLQSELKYALEKLETVEEDLKVSGVREYEILEKLKSAEEQLEHRGRAVNQASVRCLELESLHDSLVKESELKLQDALGSFTQKDSEVRQLHERIIFLEDQVAFYQDQAVEASKEVAYLKAELEACVIKLVGLESTVEELKGKVSESELKVEQSFSENELLAGTNTQLRSELEGHQSKINELNELLSSIHAEKEATAEQLASHVKTLEELTHEHSRGLELNSATEFRIRETELQLHEAVERFTQRDSEARDLNEKLLALEAQVRICEEQFREVTAISENRKVELENALIKIQNLERSVQGMQSKAEQFETENEGLARANMIQTQQLATYETKMNELEMSLNAAVADKEDTSTELHSSRKSIEDLMQQLASNEEKLQSQISSVIEENNMLNKMYQNAKEELQSVIMQLEEQKAGEISVNAELENLKSEITSMKLADGEKEAVVTSRLEEHANILHEKDVLNEQLKELQKDLNLAHSTIAEQKELESKMELERDAAIKHSVGEMEAERQHANLLENEVEELKQQLQIAETQYRQKVAEEGKKIDLLNAELNDSKDKLSQNVELEKKIADLQGKLQSVNAKSSDQSKGEIIGDVSKAGTEVKSRDLGFGSSSPSKRKSKKGSEGAHQATTEMAPISPPSGVMAFKFILGVALVSVIIGIILGKKY